MEDLLVLLIQFIVEFVFDVVANLPFDLIVSDRSAPKSDNMFGVYLLWLHAGGGLAYLSVLIVSRTFIQLPSLRIANLALAPIVASALSYAIAKRRAQTNPFIVPRQHGWQAFWFTLGLVTIRFAYASRV